jgi:hypothetical protein
MAVCAAPQSADAVIGFRGPWREWRPVPYPEDRSCSWRGSRGGHLDAGKGHHEIVEIDGDAVVGLVPDGGHASFQGTYFLVVRIRS